MATDCGGEDRLSRSVSCLTSTFNWAVLSEISPSVLPNSAFRFVTI